MGTDEIYVCVEEQPNEQMMCLRTFTILPVTFR